jgi:peptide/nickel transport system permease protein
MTTITTPKLAPEVQTETFWDSRVVKSFRRNPLAIVGLAITLTFLVVAVIAPLLAPPKGNCLRDLDATETNAVYNVAGPTFWRAIFVPPESCYSTLRIDFRPEPAPPGSVFTVDGQPHTAILGKVGGYDLWYNLVWGTRTALRVSLIVTAITLTVGVFLGSITGYFGGWFDSSLMRVIDVIYALPTFILSAVLVSFLKPSFSTIIIAFSVAGWMTYTRLLRADILKIRELEYVDGARSLGASDARVIWKYVLPNALTSLTVYAVITLGQIPLSVAALSFLGLGLPIGYADWGQAVNEARLWIRGPEGQPLAYWYVIFFPALTIILFGLGWNLLGDALRDALDPREK